MKRNSLQEGIGRLAGAIMSNKYAGSNAVWHPYLPPGVLLPEGEVSESLFLTEETQEAPPQTGQQEIQLSAGPATGGKSRESNRFPTITVQRRAALRRAVVLSEIIGEPVCRKRKRKAYGDQGNHSRG